MNVNDQKIIEQIVKEVLSSMGSGQASPSAAPHVAAPAGKSMTRADYPLAEKRPELIQGSTGKKLDDITLSAVLDGRIAPEDVRISKETLMMQGEIANSVGREAFSRNLKRAAELTQIPDQRILEIYNALRPYRSTKAELLAIAEELETQYGAVINAAHVREAAEAYEQRKRLAE